MNEMDEVLSEFLVESYENLDKLDQDFVALESDPSRRDLLASIFRTIHTIKGTCGFLGFSKLEKTAHVGETLLSKLRDGHLTLNGEMTTALLKMVDAVRQMLTNIEATQTEGDGDYSELVHVLGELATGRSMASAPTEAAPVEAPVQAPVAQAAPVQAAPVAEPAKKLPPHPTSRTDRPPDGGQIDLNRNPPRIGEVLVKQEVVPQEVVEEALAFQKDGDPRKLGDILTDMGAISQRELDESMKQTSEAKHNQLADTSIRVDVMLLDKLMNLVGELVLARNQILQHTSNSRENELTATTQRLNLITTELQENVMKTRMQPIGTIWSKVPRVVRDLSKMVGKQVRVEMEGKETELDKTIIEAIKDPLTHMIRNSVDHGIEKPETRIAAGKDPEGFLKLRAYHESGQVTIEITDDGGGISAEKVKAKAVQKGLISQEKASRMNDRDAVNLIFLPGFSTAEQVSNISGRGVGMDVVKTNIEKIGGTVDIHSQLGMGTTMKVRIPLTLAIIPALIVSCGGDRYAIPQVNLLELVRIEADAAHRSIEQIHSTPVYRLRGQLLPLIYLNRELSVDSARQTDEAINIVVLQANDRQFGLVVDGINDTEEIVVKPLAKQLKSLTLFAGATIMGDGKVALILDGIGLATRARISANEANKLRAGADNEVGETADKETLLLFHLGLESRLALPLSRVARLEEFAASQIEVAGDQLVIQYRDQILPLIQLSDILPERRLFGQEPPPPSDRIHVVVHSFEDRSVGLIVDCILDIVETDLKARRKPTRQGVLFSAIIQEKVTEVVDVMGIVRSFDPEFYDTSTEYQAAI